MRAPARAIWPQLRPPRAHWLPPGNLEPAGGSAPHGATARRSAPDRRALVAPVAPAGQSRIVRAGTPDRGTMATLIETADFGADAPVAHGWRREIDGLRAVAVLPVILFHAGFAAFAGGYLGVDVFFVISGYLITGILLRDLAAGALLARPLLRAPRPPHPAGADRRAPRLHPLRPRLDVAARAARLRRAASSPPSSRSPTSSSGSELDYFGPAAEHLPLLHTWSLGIEEQFYLLFPLALAALWRWRPAASLAPSSPPAPPASPSPPGPPPTHPQAGFFLLPFRAWELLLGAALAMAPAPAPAPPGAARARRPRSPSLVAMAAVPLGSSRASCRSSSPAPAPASSSATPAPATAAGRLLATPPPVGIGLVSYSAYLWHQPILAFARIRFGDALPPGGAARPRRPRGPARLADLGLRRAPVPPPRRRLLRAARSPSPPRPSPRCVAIGAAGLATNGLDGAQVPPRCGRSSPPSPTPTRTATPARPTSTDANPVHPVAACLVDGSAARRRLLRRQPRRRAAGRPLAARRGRRLPLLLGHPQRLPADPRPRPHRRRRLARLRRLRPRRRGLRRGRRLRRRRPRRPLDRRRRRHRLRQRRGRRRRPARRLPDPDRRRPRHADADAPAAVDRAPTSPGSSACSPPATASSSSIRSPRPAGTCPRNSPAAARRSRDAGQALHRAATSTTRRHAAVLAAFDAIDSPNLFRVRPADLLCARPDARPLHQQPRRPPALLRQQPPEHLRRRPGRAADRRRHRSRAASTPPIERSADPSRRRPRSPR